MSRADVTATILQGRIIAIVRASDTGTARTAARALLGVGMPAVEIATTTPGALEIVRELADEAPASTVVGGGTVLDASSARMAIDAGAQFLVSPTLDRGMIETAHRHGVVAVPGVATPTEIARGLEAGADLLKVFPTVGISPEWVRAMLAAIPHAPLVPTGGVTVGDARAWIDAGAVAVGMGSALTGGTAEEIARTAAELRRSLS